MVTSRFQYPMTFLHYPHCGRKGWVMVRCTRLQLQAVWWQPLKRADIFLPLLTNCETYYHKSNKSGASVTSHWNVTFLKTTFTNSWQPILMNHRCLITSLEREGLHQGLENWENFQNNRESKWQNMTLCPKLSWRTNGICREMTIHLSISSSSWCYEVIQSSLRGTSRKRGMKSQMWRRSTSNKWQSTVSYNLICKPSASSRPRKGYFKPACKEKYQKSKASGEVTNSFRRATPSWTKRFPRVPPTAAPRTPVTARPNVLWE